MGSLILVLGVLSSSGSISVASDVAALFDLDDLRCAVSRSLL